jgi:hypothetical protein
VQSTKYGGGWGLQSCRQKVKDTAALLANRTKNAWFLPSRRSYIENPRNTTYGIFGEAVKFAFDTVPICVDDTAAMFQPKYQRPVAKVLTCCTLTGFTLFVSKPFTGSTNDGVIQQYTELSELLGGWSALGDGGFTATENIIVPPRGPEIWPKRLAPGQTIEAYRANAETLLRLVEAIAHFRARVEHTYGRGGFGRFKAFDSWRSDDEFLADAVQCAFGALNVEIDLRHGTQGRYKERTPAEVDELRAKIEQHRGASSRYPPVDPLPPARPPREPRRPREPDVPEEAVVVPDGINEQQSTSRRSWGSYQHYSPNKQ